MMRTVLLALILLVQVSWIEASVGESLEQEMWGYIKLHNWSAVENHIASNFQSIHTDGSRTRPQEVALIQALTLNDYTLSDFRVTENGGVIVVTYMAEITDLKDPKNPVKTKDPRMSVWQNNYGNWQWIAHANLTPIAK